MGKRGPQTLGLDRLRRRGSWLASAKEKTARDEKRREEWLRKQKQADKMVTMRPLPSTAAQWRKLLRMLPGYDPYANRGKARFRAALARDAITFFETQLRHVKGEKAFQPFLLEDWQRSLIANLFGWKRSDGTRRFREALLFIPRKNGKTAMAAGIVLYGLFCDGEPCAEIYGAASEYKQASLVFEHARGMVEQNDVLRQQSQVFKGQAKAIELVSDYSVYRVISSDAYSKHGYNTHMAVVDELHTHPTGELVETLVTSTGARREPLIVHITTSDYEREGSICNEKHDYACKVRDGVIDDPSFLPVIYEASKDDDWTDPAVWEKANPNLGVCLSREFLARGCQRAQETPTFENAFRRLHLNVRTEQDVRWIKMDLWDQGNDPVDVESLAGRTCYAGLDLASTQDTTALVLLFPNDDGVYDVLPYFWLPRGSAHERERRDKVPYLTWARQSYMILTDGNATDYAVVQRDINELGQRFAIKEIAVDRLFQGEETCQRLAEQYGFEVIAFGQGYASMFAPTVAFERLLLDNKLRHGGNPVLRWQAGNVTVKMDEAGCIKPDKKKSTDRIDGIVATIMALGRAMMRTDTESHYNKNELFVI